MVGPTDVVQPPVAPAARARGGGLCPVSSGGGARGGGGVGGAAARSGPAAAANASKRGRPSGLTRCAAGAPEFFRGLLKEIAHEREILRHVHQERVVAPGRDDLVVDDVRRALVQLRRDVS